jgi:hypothetical protein
VGPSLSPSARGGVGGGLSRARHAEVAKRSANRTAYYFPGGRPNLRKWLSPSLIGEQSSRDSAELLTETANAEAPTQWRSER